jgi:hypothetical protein
MSLSNYVILDAARIGDRMDEAKTLNTRNISLYQNKDELSIQSVAPFIFKYESVSDFASWLSKEGWGNAWGIFIVARADMNQIHYHLSGFNRVKKDDGTQMYFRYYDPRVLRIFLRNYNTNQLATFFGLIDRFICEDEDPATALVFSFDGRKLHTERVATGSIFVEVHESPANEILVTDTYKNPGNTDSIGKIPGWFTK